MTRASVIIPTYDRAEVLPRAIDSVLAQSFKELELIVVDDASTDETESVVRSYEDPRITYLSHDTNRGGSAARNTGIEASTGEYVAFLDSDDEWLPTKLERQITHLNARQPEWVAVYCDYRIVRTGLTSWVRDVFSDVIETTDSGPREGGEELIPALLTERFGHGGASTLLVKRTAIARIDGFDESFSRHQDLEFLIRLLHVGKLAHLAECLVLKHQFDTPSAEAVIKGKREFLAKFADEIEAVEPSTSDIYDYHRYKIAQYCFRDGQFRRGLSYLQRSTAPAPRQMASLAYAVLTGVRASVARTTTTG